MYLLISLCLKNDIDQKTITATLQLLSLLDVLSYKKIATQSHTYPSNDFDASNAVDGNSATCMRTLEIGFTSPRQTVWWKVDLGDVYTINSINILFRTYDGYGIKFV